MRSGFGLRVSQVCTVLFLVALVRPAWSQTTTPDPDEETPVAACCLLPPSGSVELVPQPIRRLTVMRAAIPMIFRNMIFPIIAERESRTQAAHVL